MPEGFELVRTIRQHLRRGAAFLDEGRPDDALAETRAALALDAESLPAQALLDRIERVRHLPASFRPVVSSTPVTPPATSSSSYVPHGVNAASWRGFEQRIQERRFRALVETVNTSIVAGDAVAARVALEEARELRPEAPELAALESRVAAVVPLAVPTVSAPPSRIWMRALGAAAMLFVGVSMLLGLEWMRPSQPLGPVAISTNAPATPATAAPGELRLADVPQAQPEAGGVNEDDSVPAIVTPPEPTLEPQGTTGTIPAEPRAPAPSRPIASTETPAAPTPAVTEPVETRRAVLEEPIRPAGEVPDDYVTRPETTHAAAAPTEVARPPVQAARAPSTLEAPRSPGVDQRAAEADAVVPAAAVTRREPAALASREAAVVLPREESRVEEVLRRYARAYASLDASAAAAVWPTVDEKALARAFRDLASQNVSFDTCAIDIRGAVANASCQGEASYVVKVGSREQRTEPRTWRFELRRDGEAWKIENAEARRITATPTSYR